MKRQVSSVNRSNGNCWFESDTVSFIFMKGEKIMSIDQFDLILSDMYRIDAWLPPLFGKWMDDFKRTSYSKWAIDELEEFISKQIYPRTDGTIDEFYELTEKFKIKMSRYSNVNPKARKIFQSAVYMAENIMDLLQALSQG